MATPSSITVPASSVTPASPADTAVVAVASPLAAVTTATGVVYELKISLKYAKPPIWRRVQVADTTSMAELHTIIQRTMGWNDSHCHKFTFPRRYGKYKVGRDDSDDDDDSLEDLYNPNRAAQKEANRKLCDVLKSSKTKFSYLYDFGDNWEHDIIVEKTLPRDANQQYPVCVGGKMACPPEDSGGIYAYYSVIEAGTTGRQDPDNQLVVQWLEERFGPGGSIDPKKFDVQAVNEALQSLRA